MWDPSCLLPSRGTRVRPEAVGDAIKLVIRLELVAKHIASRL
jgi:hypothetical protein